jgi:hypothetical protein
LVELYENVDEDIKITCLLGFSSKYFEFLKNIFINVSERYFEVKAQNIKAILKKINLII